MGYSPWGCKESDTIYQLNHHPCCADPKNLICCTIGLFLVAFGWLSFNMVITHVYTQVVEQKRQLVKFMNMIGFIKRLWIKLLESRNEKKFEIKLSVEIFK